MRTVTAGQLTELASRSRKELVRVKVENASEVLTDLSDSFVGGSLSANLDAMAVTGSLTFWREQASASLAPLMNAAQPIKPGRQVTFEVAVIDSADSVAGGDWVLIFDGVVDTVGWGGDDSQIVVPVRDKAGTLRDTWIEAPKTYGNTTSPVAVETVMQSLLDDTLGTDVVVLNTIGDPDFGIILYEQQEQSLADALGAHRNLIGWDLRYIYDDSSGDFLLTFYEPARSKTIPDHTFTTDDYFSLTEVAQTAIGIRNVIKVRYADDVSVTAEDAISIADFGRQFMKLDFENHTQINTEAAATVLATAILGDLSQPGLTHVSDNAFFWPVELGDYYQFEPNEVHYNEPQKVAVVAYTHTLSPEGNSTTLQCRGNPSGGSARWYKEGKLVRDKREITEPAEITFADTLKVLYTINLGSRNYSEPSDGTQSHGPYISTTLLTDGYNDLFRAATEVERGTGITFYKQIGVINSNEFPESLTWGSVKVWLDDNESDITWSIALDPAGVGTYTRTEPLGTHTPVQVETVEPSTSPPLAWVEPDHIGHADALDVGDVAAGEGFIIHIRLVLPASPDPAAQTTDSLVKIASTV